MVKLFSGCLVPSLQLWYHNEPQSHGCNCWHSLLPITNSQRGSFQEVGSSPSSCCFFAHLPTIAAASSTPHSIRVLTRSLLLAHGAVWDSCTPDNIVACCAPSPPQYPYILFNTPSTPIGLLAWESHFLLFNYLCGPGVTLATGATRIAIANQCGHMILCFAIASFNDGNSVSSCSCNLRIICSSSPV